MDSALHKALRDASLRRLRNIYMQMCAKDAVIREVAEAYFLVEAPVVTDQTVYEAAVDKKGRAV